MKLDEAKDSKADEIRELSMRLARLDRNRMNQLVELRRRNGLTQEDVAKRLGVSKRWVRKMEEYDNDPRLSDIRRYIVAVTVNV
jgi:predicted transcriptional regulator